MPNSNNENQYPILYRTYQIIVYPNSGSVYVLETVNHTILSDDQAAIVLQGLIEDKESGIELSGQQSALFENFIKGTSREFAK